MFKTRKTPSLRKTPSRRKTPSVRGLKLFNNTKMNINSSKPVLEQLFNMVYNKSYILRKKHTVQKRRNNSKPKFDGAGFWQPIKAIFSKDKNKATSWIHKLDTTEEARIMSLTEKNANGIMNEKNHFLIQQVRIPHNEEPVIGKILQIALNMGQYKGIVEGEGTNHNPRYLFHSIYDFINSNDVVELSEKIKKQDIDDLGMYLDSLSEKSVSKKSKTKKRNNM
jgi:hypothetical protein